MNRSSIADLNCTKIKNNTDDYYSLDKYKRKSSEYLNVGYAKSNTPTNTNLNMSNNSSSSSIDGDANYSKSRRNTSRSRDELNDEGLSLIDLSGHSYKNIAEVTAAALLKNRNSHVPYLSSRRNTTAIDQEKYLINSYFQNQNYQHINNNNDKSDLKHRFSFHSLSNRKNTIFSDSTKSNQQLILNSLNQSYNNNSLSQNLFK
jgi:hypothetical protein